MGGPPLAAGSVFSRLGDFELAVNAYVRNDGHRYAKKKEGNTVSIVCKSRQCQASFTAIKNVSETEGSSWRVVSVNNQHTCSSSIATSSSSSASPVRTKQSQQQRTFMPTPSDSDRSSESSVASSSAHVASLLTRKKDVSSASPDKGKARESAVAEVNSIRTPRSNGKMSPASARKSAPRVSFPASPATVVILQCKGCEDRGILCSGKPAENRQCAECTTHNTYSRKRNITCGTASMPRRIEPVLGAEALPSEEDDSAEQEEVLVSTSRKGADGSSAPDVAVKPRKTPTLDNLFDDDVSSAQAASPRKRKQRPPSPSPSSESFVSSSTTSRSARSLHGDDSYAASDASSSVVHVKQEEEESVYSNKKQKVSETKSTPVRHSPRFARKTSAPRSTPKIKVEDSTPKRKAATKDSPEDRILQSRWRSSNSRSSSPSIEVCAKSSALSPLSSLKRKLSRNTPVSLDPALNENNSQSPSYTRSIRQSSKKKAIPAWAAEVNDDAPMKAPQIVGRRLSSIPGFPPRVLLRFQALKVETLEDLSGKGVLAQDHKDLIKFLATAPEQKPLQDGKEEAFDEIEAWLAERRLAEAMAAV